jgi:hypothetical protein
MRETLAASSFDDATRDALLQFFEHSSAYVIREAAGQIEHTEIEALWKRQLALDETVALIGALRHTDAIASAPQFRSRRAVFAGLLARMIRSGSADLIEFVLSELDRDRSLQSCRFSGRTLLHCAAGAGCLTVVQSLLQLGTDPDILDSGGHTPLYSVANECRWSTGPEVVRALVLAGADVNACDGVTNATPLHMAARRGFVEIARTLLDCGADIDARDRRGTTPLQRALNCRKQDVARLLKAR